MHQQHETQARKVDRRRPGRRPEAREREELLLQVERSLAHGAKNPGEVLGDVPDLGTWDTAKAYVDEVRARWRDSSEKDALREARGEMAAAVRIARQRAVVGMSLAEKPSEIARLAREVERLVRCEAWLLGLDPATLDREEDEEGGEGRGGPPGLDRRGDGAGRGRGGGAKPRGSESSSDRTHKPHARWSPVGRRGVKTSPFDGRRQGRDGDRVTLKWFVWHSRPRLCIFGA